MRVLGLSRTGHLRLPQDPYYQGISHTILRLGLRWASHLCYPAEFPDMHVTPNYGLRGLSQLCYPAEFPDMHVTPFLHLRRDSHIRGDGRMSPSRHRDPSQLYCLRLITCVNKGCRYCLCTCIVTDNRSPGEAVGSHRLRQSRQYGAAGVLCQCRDAGAHRGRSPVRGSRVRDGGWVRWPSPCGRGGAWHLIVHVVRWCRPGKTQRAEVH
jgi:hypothetical protein